MADSTPKSSNFFSNVGTILKGGDEVVSAKEAREVALASAAIGAVGGGMFTRKRVAAGKEPILKVLF